jgi:uncharacterized membrane protein YebE (DUF533 family)
MGLLTQYTALELAAPGDARALRDVLSAVGSVDGVVDAQESALIAAFFRTIPQLRDEPVRVPPRAAREALLAELGALPSERLRRQCFVVAVELAIASDGVNDAEDAYLTALQKALRIDDAFARAVLEVMACKYARAAAD